jgi:PhzF family phenazine biosynthesis protein
MDRKIYIVNAFTKDRFGGNPAAVVPLDEWLPDQVMQDMAAQHNLAETAFFVPNGQEFEIRWFTPTIEVDLCGHATLAAAQVCFEQGKRQSESVTFHSRSGPLPVNRQTDGKITLDFPADVPNDAGDQPQVERGLRAKPTAVFRARFDYMAVFEKQADIENLRPDIPELARLPSRGLITTARGDNSDFVTRCFYPQSGINEDPVTGSAYMVAAPYWSGLLGKKDLIAFQLSRRKGHIECSCRGERVLISGYAYTYLSGSIRL